MLLLMTDDDSYFWHRQQQRAHWQMPPGTRPDWVRSRLVPPRILTLPLSHVHVRSLFILRWCRTIRVVCTAWVP